MEEVAFTISILKKSTRQDVIGLEFNDFPLSLKIVLVPVKAE